MAGTQHTAINKHNLTLVHMRIVADLKKYNTIQTTDKSHSLQGAESESAMGGSNEEVGGKKEGK